MITRIEKFMNDDWYEVWYPQLKPGDRIRVWVELSSGEEIIMKIGNRDESTIHSIDPETRTVLVDAPPNKDIKILGEVKL